MSEGDNLIYLDNASTTRIDDEVLDAMLPYLKEEYGNPGALYPKGRNAAEAVEHARRQVAEYIGAYPNQIVFTSGGSEANSMVFFGTARHLFEQGKPNIVTTLIEHDSVLRATRALRDKTRFIKDGFYTYCLSPESDGRILPDKVESMLNGIEKNLSSYVGLVSVMHTNNETGARNLIGDIAGICADHGALFHTDAVAAAGCCNLDVEELGCDFMSLSAHKIHGPKGVGALFVRDKTILSPVIYGGSNQEFGLRGGTENVASIVGFGKACEIASARRGDNIRNITAMRNWFLSQLRAALCSEGIAEKLHINGELASTGKTLNLRFDGVDAETLVLALGEAGVCISAGSACTSHESEPSHVLTAMGISEWDARSSVRVSFSRMNTFDEVEKAASIMAQQVAVLSKTVDLSQKI